MVMRNKDKEDLKNKLTALYEVGLPLIQDAIKDNGLKSSIRREALTVEIAFLRLKLAMEVENLSQ